MTRHVDTLHSWKFEVPLETCLGMCEGGNESTAGSVDVNGNINSSLLLILVQDI
jgi:hypothetical protein